MNIIELFEELKIDKSNIQSFSPEEIIRIEKQINVEKRINPDIDTNAANNLVLAFKEFPQELYFVVSNRLLFNLFSKKNYSRHQFPAPQRVYDSEKIQGFINQFLIDDLVLFYDGYLSQNKFDTIADVFEYKDCFPEDALFQLNKKLIVKIDFLLMRLTQSVNTDQSDISYIQYRSFYDLLSFFSSIEMDDKVRSLTNIITERYNANRQSDFLMACISSMAGYKAYDQNLTDVLLRNRETVFANIANQESSGSSSGISARTVIFIIIAIIKILVLCSRCSSH
ncbi:hypothetical protein [Flavobacterium marginilacus]|uniref:hypothetical protein n=1 Tax=Flavobacterium marginilacus TaxID=3003256 RepID=UPI00248D68DB|nr:hypothetical protein [Flavobacterium marginilacus]